MPETATHVVVLAAGRGSRMGQLGDETPKWLLPVGDATIAERQLQGIAQARDAEPAAIASVRVVAGHARAEVEDFLRRSDGGVEVIENPDFAEINNWYSVLLAIRELPGHPEPRLVVINADLFARPEWYAGFIREAALTQEESLIAVDLARDLTDESMKVAPLPSDSGLLGTIGKVGIEEPVGEYVGMLMARGSALADLRERLEAFRGQEEHKNEWYERGVGLSAAAGTPWRIWATPDSDWVEIDDDGDYEQALALASAF